MLNTKDCKRKDKLVVSSWSLPGIYLRENSLNLLNLNYFTDSIQLVLGQSLRGQANITIDKSFDISEIPQYT